MIQAKGCTDALSPGHRFGPLFASSVSTAEDLDGWLVKEGWALAFRKYSLDYVSDEDEARQAKRGIWKGEFEAPWEWRAAHPRR